MSVIVSSGEADETSRGANETSRVADETFGEADETSGEASEPSGEAAGAIFGRLGLPTCSIVYAGALARLCVDGATAAAEVPC